MLRSACLLGLLLASGSAAALGLGQIRVLSEPGEPFVAEIPVITSDPAELQQLHARLASPATFTRVGLEPPVGVVAGLQFSTSADQAGRPVIRVTSAQPVDDPTLTFLVEVDWGQGRLVREYSALVDAPRSVVATPAAPVQAPVVSAPQVIERPRVPAPERVDPTPTQPEPVAAGRQRPAPAPAPQVAEQAPERIEVRPGDTLSTIAAEVAPDGVTTSQVMVGLLQANPQAFIRGDINQLRSGSVLRMPARAELAAIEAAEAAALVRTAAQQWRQARSQPQAPTAAAAPTAAVAAAARPTAPQATSAAGGRLEIVPPGAGNARQAGTQSGIAAGGEGDMLRQELQQTRETLATKDAELQELKSRLAELERLQKDQQRLIELKDAELVAAQQRLDAPAAASEAGNPWLAWVLLGAALLVALLAAAWVRRRGRPEPTFRAPSAGGSVASDFGATPMEVPGPEVLAEPAPVPVHDEPATPSWERRRTPATAPAVQAEQAAGVAVASPAWMADEQDGEAPSPREPEPTLPRAADMDVGSVERLELAQAYLDVGDVGKARALLVEVSETGDPTSRTIAGRMLQGMG